MLRRLSEAERRLHESEERLELALWANDLGLWDWSDERGRIVYDERYSSMLGYAPGDLDGTMESWLSRVHPYDREVVVARVEAFLVGSGELYESTHRLRAKDGEWRWIADRAKAVARDANGRPTRIVGTHRDVTHAKRMESELLHAGKMEAVGRLAGGIAHDFNNLLTMILSGVSFVGEELDAGSPLHEDLQMVRDAAQRAAELTSQLLAFARRQPVAPRVIDLNDVIAETERMLHRTIASDVVVATRVSREACRVRADAAQLQQIVLNLAVNAREAMANGGRIAIETELRDSPATPTGAAAVRSGRWVVLTVSDTGQGMDADTLRHVFEPFFTTKHRGRGTGLGLATVYGIVRQAGGHVSAASTPGQGSRFEVWLPEAESPATEAPAAVAPARGAGETVLVVDDEPLVLECTARTLEKNGYRVLRASGPAQALAFCSDRARRLDMLVSDVVMPGMNGVVLARAIERVRPGMPVLLVSGDADAGAEAIAAEQLLPKPFTAEQLAARVRAGLDAAATRERRAG